MPRLAGMSVEPLEEWTLANGPANYTLLFHREDGHDMDQVIVTLDGKDHKIGQGEHTMCMLPVPHGTSREEGAKPCKVCFPADAVEPEPEPVLSIATPADELGHYENPDSVEGEAGFDEAAKPASKPAKKATKA